MNAAAAPYTVSPRAQQALATLFVLTLLALAIWEVSRFVRNAPSNLEPGLGNANVAMQPAGSDQPPNLAQYGLFGRRTETEVAIPQVLANQASDTELTLRGTVAGEQASRGRALIEIKGDGQYVFHTGAEMPGNRVLKEVHASHVVIERNGNLSMLRLPEDEQPRSNSLPSTRLGSRSNPANQQAPRSIVDQIAMGQVSNIPRPNFDPSRIATQITPLAVREDGQLVGYKLRPGRDSRLLEQLGLNSRDVILNVDGVDLNSPGALLQLQRMRSGGPVQVRIQRDGREQTITVDPSNINP
jgi:general secretion pathway protein C